MKLLSKSFEKDGSGAAQLIPEESEDLWHLYNLVAERDTIRANTYRTVKKEGASGSVATETKKMQLTIDIRKIEYDSAGDIIRFSGTNCEENQWVKMGQHHTISIELNNKLTLMKACWDFMHLRQLDEATDVHKSAEVAVVLIDAGVANYYLLTAVLAKDVHRVSVTLPKKRLTTTGYDKAMVRFYEQVYNGIRDHIDLSLVRCVVIAGPGFVKDDFKTWMDARAVQSQDTEIMQKKSSFVLAHASCSHKQALKELLADANVQRSIANTKAAEHLKALEDFYTMIKDQPERVCYGPKQVKEAVEKGAVGVLMVTDTIFRSSTLRVRQEYVAMAEAVRETGATVHVFSSQHVSGQQLHQLSGVAAVLRYPMPELEDIDSDAGFDVEGDDDALPPSDDGGEEDDVFSP